MINLESLKTRIWNIANKRPDGFTYNTRNGQLQTKGYVVATDKTQGCIGKAGLFKVIKFCLRNRNYCIGGWKNEDGTMQFDASMVYSSADEALKAAVENGQRAIYNLYTGKEIMASDYGKYVKEAA